MKTPLDVAIFCGILPAYIQVKNVYQHEDSGNFYGIHFMCPWFLECAEIFWFSSTFSKCHEISSQACLTFCKDRKTWGFNSPSPWFSSTLLILSAVFIFLAVWTAERQMFFWAQVIKSQTFLCLPGEWGIPCYCPAEFLLLSCLLFLHVNKT